MLIDSGNRPAEPDRVSSQETRSETQGSAVDLYHFHRVLIAGATLFFLGLAVYAYRQYTQLQQSLDLWMTIGSGLICVGWIRYLAYFNAAMRRLTPRRQP